MTISLVVFFIFGFFGAYCFKDVFQYKRDTYLPGHDLKGIEQEYQEQERRVERPCPVYDMLCIRRYFARHSNCKIAEGPVPDPLYRDQSVTYFPTFGITATQNELFISGLTGSLSEFSVNRQSKLTVLKVDFRNVTLIAKKVYLRFHRRGQEPALTSSNTDREIMPSFSITTVFKGVDRLSLADSESVVSLDKFIIMELGPELGEHPDPTIAPRLATLLAQPQIAQLEGFLTVAPFYAAAFIQNAICDSHLKLN